MTDQSSFEVPGLIITPAHGQLTIPKGFRLYPANACYSCDPLTYILEGRLNNTAPWIHKFILPRARSQELLMVWTEILERYPSTLHMKVVIQVFRTLPLITLLQLRHILSTDCHFLRLEQQCQIPCSWPRLRSEVWCFLRLVGKS